MNRIVICLIGVTVFISVSLSAWATTADEQNAAQDNPTKANVLGRVVAEPGELFDPTNSPRCTLTSIAVADMPKKFSSEMRNAINWPKNYAPPQPCPYGDDDKERIVAEGIYFIPSGGGIGLRTIGKMLVDKCLNPLYGIWDGKKDGAIHRFVGKVRIFDYEFQSDKASPLVFKLTKNGYSYVEGKGTVLDLLTGQKFTFPE